MIRERDGGRKTPWARTKVEELYLDTFPNGVEEKL